MNHLVTVHPPDGEFFESYTVSGDLRAPGTGMDDEANYEARDDLAPRFPAIEFDPETSCFYAYAADATSAAELAGAIVNWVAVRRSGGST